MLLLVGLLLATSPVALPRIAIDAGHGGTQPGTLGVCGVAEKKITRALASRVHAILRSSRLVEPVLLRRADETVSLEERAQRANDAHAVMLLSIHANYSSNHKVQGIETFFLSQREATGRLAHLADLENDGLSPPIFAKAPQHTPAAVQMILQGLRLDAAHSESQSLAMRVQRTLSKQLHSRGRGVLQAPFRVLMQAEMAAALVEVGFLSNMEECRRLRHPGYQQTVATAISQAVIMHVASHHAPALLGRMDSERSPAAASIRALSQLD
jgi:N-acetylmuramoyl-L-alanine amidase